jgi:hypothetical protein
MSVVGEGGHYLNSRAELGGGVLELIRTYGDSVDAASKLRRRH